MKVGKFWSVVIVLFLAALLFILWGWSRNGRYRGHLHAVVDSRTGAIWASLGEVRQWPDEDAKQAARTIQESNRRQDGAGVVEQALTSSDDLWSKAFPATANTDAAQDAAGGDFNADALWNAAVGDPNAAQGAGE